MAQDLWLCLRFPSLPIDLYSRGQRSLEQQDKSPDSITPQNNIVVVENKTLLLCNEEALGNGLEPRMSAATAYALVDQLQVLEYDASRTRRALYQLGLWAYRFTPHVTTYFAPPRQRLSNLNHALLLEVGGCLKLFKGIQSLLALIEADLQERCFHFELGLAHTPKAAYLLSFQSHSDNLHCLDERQRPQQEQILHLLNQTPLNLLPAQEKVSQHDKLIERMYQMGFTQLGEILALPHHALAKRFGAELVRYLKQLTGALPDPQQSLTPPSRFHNELHFLDGIHNSQMLLFPMKRLLKEFSQFLTFRQLHCRSLMWKFVHHDQHHSQIVVEFSQAKNEVADFLLLTQIKLEQFKITSPIESVHLLSQQLTLAQLHNQTLFLDQQSNQQREDGGMLLDKLASRLGRHAIFTLKRNDHHLPELSWQGQYPETMTVQEPRAGYTRKRGNISQAAQQAEPPSPTIPSLRNRVRPLWLLPKAVAVSQKAGKLFYENGYLQLVTRPERVETQWWREEQQRDYFIARHDDGAYYWIYQDLVNRSWFLQGYFG